MNTLHETVEYNGFAIQIHVDSDPQNPRTEWDNFGTMACFHRRYTLGDDHSFAEPQELIDHVSRRDVVALPLYLYDHSGITMSTAPFSCPWDSGQVGYIYATHEKIREEFNVKRITKRIRNKVESILKQEVLTYDDYLTGNVYGYRVFDPEGEETDYAVWGFYGDPDKSGLLDDAKASIDYALAHPKQKDVVGQMVMEFDCVS
jgi:hypothetical protein